MQDAISFTQHGRILHGKHAKILQCLHGRAADKPTLGFNISRYVYDTDVRGTDISVPVK